MWKVERERGTIEWMEEQLDSHNNNNNNNKNCYLELIQRQKRIASFFFFVKEILHNLKSSLILQNIIFG